MNDLLAATLLAESAPSGSSDLVQIVIAFLAFASVVFNGILAYFMSRLKVGSDRAAIRVTEAAVQVEKVRTTLEDTTEATDRKLDELAKVAESTRETGEKVHTLTNSNMGLQLKVSAVALRRVADLTRDPADVAAADLAERGLREHEGKQAIVDNKEVADGRSGPA